MPHTLGQAAKATGKNRTTILRAIKAGKLSAAHDAANGEWRIEPGELHRLYPPTDAHASPPPGDAHSRNTGAGGAIRELHARLADKDSLIAAHERAIDDLRRRLDAAAAQLADSLAQTRTLTAALLTDQRPAHRSWWPWRR